ncbi:chromo domain helicase DNA binding protein [Cryptosporidium ryanae]|uniref:chromo domain helicase DNA binding protein n=1 Tax=Cryptosporidium ryanae TaxID=515981 RepID=UPI00351A1A9D|nr:chromo domain helicase DNA binding protein [Cryptosporidium ryanae]
MSSEDTASTNCVSAPREGDLCSGVGNGGESTAEASASVSVNDNVATGPSNESGAVDGNTSAASRENGNAATSVVAGDSAVTDSGAVPEPPKKRGRGRPRINREALAAAAAAAAAAASAGTGDNSLGGTGITQREPSTRRKGAGLGSLIAAEVNSRKSYIDEDEDEEDDEADLDFKTEGDNSDNEEADVPQRSVLTPVVEKFLKRRPQMRHSSGLIKSKNASLEEDKNGATGGDDAGIDQGSSPRRAGGSSSGTGVSSGPSSSNQRRIPRGKIPYEYLVKYHQQSYSQCKWITEDDIDNDPDPKVRIKYLRYIQRLEQKGVESIDATAYIEDVPELQYIDGEIERIVDCTDVFRSLYPMKAAEIGRNEWYIYCLKIIDALVCFDRKGIKYGIPFLRPVDPNMDGASDYYSVISRPMDFTTVQTKLYLRIYSQPQEFWNDVQQIFTNCFMYNSVDSDIYVQGKLLKALFDKLYGEWALLSRQTQEDLVKQKSEESPKEWLDDQTVTIETAIQHITFRDLLALSKRPIMYFTKWKHLSFADNTWEHEVDITDSSKILQFHRFVRVPEYITTAHNGPAAISYDLYKRMISETYTYIRHTFSWMNNQFGLRLNPPQAPSYVTPGHSGGGNDSDDSDDENHAPYASKKRSKNRYSIRTYVPTTFSNLPQLTSAISIYSHHGYQNRNLYNVQKQQRGYYGGASYPGPATGQVGGGALSGQGGTVYRGQQGGGPPGQLQQPRPIQTLPGSKELLDEIKIGSDGTLSQGAIAATQKLLQMITANNPSAASALSMAMNNPAIAGLVGKLLQNVNGGGSLAGKAAPPPGVGNEACVDRFPGGGLKDLSCGSGGAPIPAEFKEEPNVGLISRDSAAERGGLVGVGCMQGAHVGAGNSPCASGPGRSPIGGGTNERYQTQNERGTENNGVAVKAMNETDMFFSVGGSEISSCDLKADGDVGGVSGVRVDGGDVSAVGTSNEDGYLGAGDGDCNGGGSISLCDGGKNIGHDCGGGDPRRINGEEVCRTDLGMNRSFVSGEISLPSSVDLYDKLELEYKNIVTVSGEGSLGEMDVGYKYAMSDNFQGYCDGLPACTTEDGSSPSGSVPDPPQTCGEGAQNDNSGPEGAGDASGTFSAPTSTCLDKQTFSEKESGGNSVGNTESVETGEPAVEGACAGDDGCAGGKYGIGSAETKQEVKAQMGLASLVANNKIAELYSSQKRPPPPPPGVSRHYLVSPIFKNGYQLFDYQLAGLNWLLQLWSEGRNGILADEMGLGKTMQTMSFVWHLVYKEKLRGPFLVVAPLSTLDHWKRTFEDWTDLNVVLYYDEGGRNGRDLLRYYEFYHQCLQFDMRGRGRTSSQNYGNNIKNYGYINEPRLVQTKHYKFHILLTSYEILLADADILCTMPWQFIIIDEAHRLKNRGAKTLQVFKSIACRHILLLSGTPVQNNTEELWPLLNYIEPIKFASIEAFTQEFGELQSSAQVTALHELLRPHLLRRVKEDVMKEIPPLEETIIDVELTTAQKAYYRAIFERNRAFLCKNIGFGKKSSSAPIPSLMNVEVELRKCCNHPFQVVGVEEREVALCKTTEDRYKKMIELSGKMVLMGKLLPKLKAEGHRVLIFSQFIQTLTLLEELIEHHGWGYERLDGSIRGTDRTAAIARFNAEDSDKFVFLLSTRAGGLGINLTSADTVIIFDSDWNPQNDVQACARAHRIGQTRDVKVYRLITARTYEAEMFERASKKLGLNTAVFHKGAFREESSNGSGGGGSNGIGTGGEPTKQEIEDLLKHGAYYLLEGSEASRQFQESDIDEILSKNSRLVRYQLSGKNSSFSKTSFRSDNALPDLDVNDPDFWKKVLGDSSVSSFLVQLQSGSAIRDEESREKFIQDLADAVDGAAALDSLDPLIEALVQVTNMREFSELQRQKAEDLLANVQDIVRTLQPNNGENEDDEDGSGNVNVNEHTRGKSRKKPRRSSRAKEFTIDNYDPDDYDDNESNNLGGSGNHSGGSLKNTGGSISEGRKGSRGLKRSARKPNTSANKNSTTNLFDDEVDDDDDDDFNDESFEPTAKTSKGRERKPVARGGRTSTRSNGARSGGALSQANNGDSDLNGNQGDYFSGSGGGAAVTAALSGVTGARSRGSKRRKAAANDSDTVGASTSSSANDNQDDKEQSSNLSSAYSATDNNTVAKRRNRRDSAAAMLALLTAEIAKNEDDDEDAE